jgi:hypothetical protein
MAVRDFIFRLESTGSGAASDIATVPAVWTVAGSFLPLEPIPTRPLVSGLANEWLVLAAPPPDLYEPVLQLWGGWSQATEIATEWNVDIEAVDLSALCSTRDPVVENATTGDLPHQFSQIITLQTPLGAGFEARLVVQMQSSVFAWISRSKPRPRIEAPRTLVTKLADVRSHTFPARYRGYLVPSAVIDNMAVPFRYLLMGRPGEPLDWALALHWLRITGVINRDCHEAYTSPMLKLYIDSLPQSALPYQPVCSGGWRVAETWYSDDRDLALAHAGRLLAGIIACPFLQSIYALDRTFERAETGAVKVSGCESMYTPLPNARASTHALVGDCEEAAVCNQHVFLGLRHAFRILVGPDVDFSPHSFQHSHKTLADRLEPKLGGESTAAERALLVSLAFLAMQYSCLSVIITTNDESISGTVNPDLTRISAGLHATTLLLPVCNAVGIFGLDAADQETTLITRQPYVDDRQTPDSRLEEQPLRYICLAINPRLRGLVVEATNQIHPLINATKLTETMQSGGEFKYTTMFQSILHNRVKRDSALDRIRKITQVNQGALLDDSKKLIGVPCMLHYGEFYGMVLQACLLGRTEWILGQHTLADLLEPTARPNRLSAMARLLAPDDISLAQNITLLGRLRDEPLDFVMDRARRRIPFPLFTRLPPVPLPRTAVPEESNVIPLVITAATLDAKGPGFIDLAAALKLLKAAKCTTEVTELTAYALAGSPASVTTVVLAVTLP